MQENEKKGKKSFELNAVKKHIQSITHSSLGCFVTQKKLECFFLHISFLNNFSYFIPQNSHSQSFLWQLVSQCYCISLRNQTVNLAAKM